MRKVKFHKANQFTGEKGDLERNLVVHISNTGKEQIKRRRKRGLSAYYLKDGVIIELTPSRKEIKGKQIQSRWIFLEKSKRTLVLK